MSAPRPTRVVRVRVPVEEIDARPGDILTTDPQTGRILLARELGAAHTWDDLSQRATGLAAPQYPFLARLGASRGVLA